jgi:hypothetical protein
MLFCVFLGVILVVNRLFRIFDANQILLPCLSRLFVHLRL